MEGRRVAVPTVLQVATPAELLAGAPPTFGCVRGAPILAETPLAGVIEIGTKEGVVVLTLHLSDEVGIIAGITHIKPLIVLGGQRGHFFFFLQERKKQMIVVAFDIGTKNFAFAVVDVNGEDWGNVLHIDVHDLRDGDVYKNLISYLTIYHHLWRKAEVVLIEQQLNRMNIKATKLACHLHAYFLHQHPKIPVYEYPSLYKTKYTDCPLRSSTHKQRKEYAIQSVLDHYEEKDPVLFQWISSFPKKDDICDTVLMCNTFLKSPLYKLFSASLPDTDAKTDFHATNPPEIVGSSISTNQQN